MKTFIISAFVILNLFQPAFAQQGNERSISEATSPQRNVRVVLAQGMGSTIESASKNAAENALKQVVGTFIDAETQIKRRTEINDGIRSQASSMESRKREYSQGSIRGFEVVDTLQDGGIVRVEAKVTVQLDDLKAFMAKVGVGEQIIDGGLATMLGIDIQQQQNLEQILSERVGRSIATGEVVELDVGKPIRFSTSGLDRSLLGTLNPTTTIVIPITVSLRQDYLTNLRKTLASTSKTSDTEYWSPGLNARAYELCGHGDAGSKVDPFTIAISDHGVEPTYNQYGWTDGKAIPVEVYTFSEVRRLPALQDNQFRVSVLGNDGAPIDHLVFRPYQLESQGGKGLIPSSVGSPWSLIRNHSGTHQCYEIKRNASFKVLYEIDPETLQRASKIQATFN